MPMPPVINPYDPRKKQQQPAQQQPGQQPGQQQPAQPAQPSQAVQSSLPPMQQPQQPQQAPVQQQKKPAAPVTYQQQAGAVADPRFSQALAQKLQSDVAAKTAALQQQQAQFQEELNKASGGVPAQERISGLLGKITSGQASEAELSEYDKLQKMQYQGPMGLQGTANIAALSQLAGSPELLAQQYAGFAPGGVRPGDFAKAMAGLQRSPELSSAQQAASGLAQKAMSAEEIAAQQAGLLKGQTEAAKTQAETAVKAEQEKYMAGLGEEAKGQIEAKKGALDNLKEGLFMGKSVSKAALKKLGLSTEDVQNLKTLDFRSVGGLGEIKSLDDLDKAVKALETKQSEAGSSASVLTPEQQKLISVYKNLGEVGREQDEDAGIAYAQKGDLAKINALRRLTGQPLLKEEDIGKGAESGGVSKDKLSALKGSLSDIAGQEATDVSSVKTARQGILNERNFNDKLVNAYDVISSMDSTKWDVEQAKKTGMSFDKYLDKLEKDTKAQKDSNPHASWLYDRLQRMKGLLGWDRKAIKKLAKAQKKEVAKRRDEYKKQIEDVTKQEMGTSSVLGNLKLTD
jgi:hypothetical protein